MWLLFRFDHFLALGRPASATTILLVSIHPDHLLTSCFDCTFTSTYAPEFKALTGIEVEVVDFPYLTLYEKMGLSLSTGDDSYDHWEYGISELLISSLSTSNELTVVGNQTITDVIQNVENVQTASIGPDAMLSTCSE